MSLPSPPRLHVWCGYCAHASASFRRTFTEIRKLFHEKADAAFSYWNSPLPSQVLYQPRGRSSEGCGNRRTRQHSRSFRAFVGPHFRRLLRQVFFVHARMIRWPSLIDVCDLFYRLWCVFEVASFVHRQGAERLILLPIHIPARVISDTLGFPLETKVDLIIKLKRLLESTQILHSEKPSHEVLLSGSAHACSQRW